MSKIKTEWKLRVLSSEYRRKVDHSRGVIRAAAKKGSFMLSWSAGKDSTAMTHLVKSLCPDVPIVIQFDDCDWPTKREYVERVSVNQGWDFKAVEPDFSVWERASSGRIGYEDFCSVRHPLTRYGFLEPMSDAQHTLGCNGIYMGLRAKESYARAMNFRSRGALYQLKNEEWRCCPVVLWTAEDVFAYHIDNGIEINPCYFQNKFKEPEEIRLSWAIPTPESIRYGNMEHIRYYYHEQYSRLRDLGVV